jgi:hypothetical protein
LIAASMMTGVVMDGFSRALKNLRNAQFFSEPCYVMATC